MLGEYLCTLVVVHLLVNHHLTPMFSRQGYSSKGRERQRKVETVGVRGGRGEFGGKVAGEGRQRKWLWGSIVPFPPAIAPAWTEIVVFPTSCGHHGAAQTASLFALLIMAQEER